MCKLQELLGDEFEHFESLDSFEKASFVLGSEMWEDDFSSRLDLVKDYIVDVWERRLGFVTKISAFGSHSVRIHL